MRKIFFIAVACSALVGLLGCQNDRSNAPPPPGAGLPDPNTKLTGDQTEELKNRLDKLEVGMPRAKVLEIIDLSSFNVHYYSDASSSGMTFRFEGGHVLIIGFDAGDYDSTLRFVKLDGESWPKGPGTIRKPKQTPPPAAPQQ